MYQNSPTRRTNIQNSSVSQSFAKFPQTLTHKIIECNMRKNNHEYQKLLIVEKEAELRLLDEKTKNKNRTKQYQRIKGKVENMNAELNKLKQQKNKQEHYLKEYYQFLDQKLKLGTKSIVLYAGLQKLDEELHKNYEQEKNSLEESLEELQKQSEKYISELEKIDKKKQFLKQELEITKIEKQAQNVELQNRQIAAKKQKQESFKQLQFYKKGIVALTAQKAALQKEQKTLQKTRNLQEVHKKHWLSIQNAIKKEFTYKIKQKNYKEAVSQQYKMKLPDLETTVNMKKYERDVLADEIYERKKKVEDIKSVLNFSMNRMSKVSSDMINRNSTA